MKRVTKKWFFFNPLYILYTDDKWYLEKVKNYNTDDPVHNFFYDWRYDVYKDPWDYGVRQMGPRDNWEIEREIIHHESANRLRKEFRENQGFSNEDFFPTLEFESEKLPIALITFVLSVFLATDESLRYEFYNRYQGKTLPAVTQWCLNTFRLGPISDAEVITGFHLIDDEYCGTLACCGLANSFADLEALQGYTEYMVVWFSLWDEHFKSSEKNYLEPVEFKPVPMVSTGKNILCGLTVEPEGGTCSEGCYFHELSDRQKKVYTMLARVLDTVCVPENTELIIPHTDLVKRGFSFDEREITAELIRFIVSECKTFF